MATPISNTSLIEACKDGDTLILEELLRTREHPKETHDSNEAMLLEPSLIDAMLPEAVRNTRKETVRFLLKRYPKTLVNEEMVRAVLGTGSVAIYTELLSHDPKIMEIDLFEGRSSQLERALGCYVSPAFVDFLLISGVDPNPASPALPPLCLAAGAWQTESLELSNILIRHGCKIEHSGALAAAAKSGRMGLVKFLIEKGARVNDTITNPIAGHKWPALHTAIENGHDDIAVLPLDQNWRTAYKVAEAVGNVRILEFLHGDENVKGIRGVYDS